MVVALRCSTHPRVVETIPKTLIIAQSPRKSTVLPEAFESDLVAIQRIEELRSRKPYNIQYFLVPATSINFLT